MKTHTEYYYSHSIVVLPIQRRAGQTMLLDGSGSKISIRRHATKQMGILGFSLLMATTPITQWIPGLCPRAQHPGSLLSLTLNSCVSGA